MFWKPVLPWTLKHDEKYNLPTEKYFVLKLKIILNNEQQTPDRDSYLEILIIRHLAQCHLSLCFQDGRLYWGHDVSPVIDVPARWRLKTQVVIMGGWVSWLVVLVPMEQLERVWNIFTIFVGLKITGVLTTQSTRSGFLIRFSVHSPDQQSVCLILDAQVVSFFLQLE